MNPEEQPGHTNTRYNPHMIAPSDGMQLSGSVTLAPGVYHLPNGLRIAQSDTVINGNGAILICPEQTGTGLSIESADNVFIRSLTIIGYRHGVRSTHCKNLTIEACRITGTAELPANTDFLDIWLPSEQAYGAGICLIDCSDSAIRDNDLQHQMNGLLTYGCKRLKVERNVANYCSGYGFHLYETSDSEFEGNYADFCCRYHPRGPRHGHMGADATGFLIVKSSSRNRFSSNFARCGGDGFFMAGLAPDGVPCDCEANEFIENDGSFSPNIAFEGTFCTGTLYKDNRADYCNYGFWLGFSRDCRIEGNQMIGNRQAGIAVENGVRFQVRNNRIHANGHGLLIWSKRVEAFSQSAPDNDTSREWQITDNEIVRNGTGIRIAAEQDHGIRPLTDQPPAPPPSDHLIMKNGFQDNRISIDLLGAHRTRIEQNALHGAEVNLRQSDCQETDMKNNPGAVGGYL